MGMRIAMKNVTIVLSLALVCGCSSRGVPSTDVDNEAVSSSHSIRGVVGVFAATLMASSACASMLEAEARVRTYTATLRSDGRINWSGTTLNPPARHTTISSGVFSDGALAFSIDIEREPQFDYFHGLWEEFGRGMFLNISGTGKGTDSGREVTGTFDGLFALYDPLDPPWPGILPTAHYCAAKDHQFRFVKH
jgi:hypothetical protein